MCQKKYSLMPHDMANSHCTWQGVFEFMTIVLNTQRLNMTPIQVSDAEQLHVLWTDPEVRRYLWDDKVVSTQTVDEIIASSSNSFEQLGYGFFALRMLEDPIEGHGLMGFCGHRLFDSESGSSDQVELLYGILPQYWGQGLGTEAARAALDYGFQTCEFNRVIAATDTPNQRSVRVLQRLGMSFEARREWHGLDTIFYALTQTEHLENQATV